MKLINLAVLLSVICLQSSQAIANGVAPRKYSKCEVLSKIRTPNGSAGHYIDSGCGFVYVLPPIKGGIELESYVDYLGKDSFLCKADNGRTIIENDTIVLKNNKKIDELAKKISDLKVSIVENESYCTNEVDNELDYSSEYKECNSNVALWSDQIIRLEERLKTAIGRDLIAIQSELDRARIKKNNFESMLPSKELRMLKAKNDLVICKQKLEERKSVLVNDFNQNTGARDLMISENSSLLDHNRNMFDGKKGVQGGIMTFSLVSDQLEMVKRYQEMNTDLKNIVFQPMPLSGTNLSFSVVKNGIKNGYPVIDQAFLSGVQLNVDNSLDSIPFKDIESDQSQNIILGAAVGGKAVINQFAACMIPSSIRYGTNSSTNHQYLRDIAGTMNGTMTYRYQLAVSRKLSINYNEKQLYCLIKKQTTSNGLFSSTTSSSLTETSENTQWLTITADSDDNGFDFQNRESLAMDLRKEYLDRALLNVAKSYLTNERADLVAPPEPGAVRISNKLSKCSGLFCTFGSVLLDLGHSLFGSTSASSTTCKNVGVSSVLQIEDTKPVYAYGTQSFTLKPGK